MSVCESTVSNAEHVKHNHMNVGPVVRKPGFLLEHRYFGAGCEGGGRSGKHRSWILIKSLNMWRLDCLSPPDSNNLAHFLGASLSSSSPLPPNFLAFTPNRASPTSR